MAGFVMANFYGLGYLFDSLGSLTQEVSDLRTGRTPMESG